MSDDEDDGIAEVLAGMVQHYTPPAPSPMRAQLAAELAQMQARLGPQWGAYALPLPGPSPANLR
ncbi:MAG: hypothetical protein WCJ64_00805 [Rhodospirillaceae bacterium]